MRQITAREIVGVEWNRVPDRVEPGERFDLSVRVFGSADEETEGQPITFYINDEQFFITTGANIDPGEFAFDGKVNAQINEPGVYRLHAEVAGYRTNDHIIGVGEEPNGDAVGDPDLGSLVSVPGALVVGAVGAEVLRRIFT